MKRFCQTMVSLIAACGILYAVSLSEFATNVVCALCVAIVTAVCVIWFNGWIFSDAPKKSKKSHKHCKCHCDEDDDEDDDFVMTDMPTELFNYEAENNQCDLCDKPTCKGCELYEIQSYNVDDIIKEFSDSASKVGKDSSVSLEELV